MVTTKTVERQHDIITLIYNIIIVERLVRIAQVDTVVVVEASEGRTVEDDDDNADRRWTQRTRNRTSLAREAVVVVAGNPERSSTGFVFVSHCSRRHKFVFYTMLNYYFIDNV